MALESARVCWKPLRQRPLGEADASSFAATQTPSLGLESGSGHATTQLNRAFVDQSAQSLSNSLLRSCELILAGGHPSHLTVGDHAGGHGFEKKFSERHGTDEVAITLMGRQRGCMTCSPFFMSKEALKGTVDLIVEA